MTGRCRWRWLVGPIGSVLGTRQQIQTSAFVQHVTAHLRVDVGAVGQGPHVGQRRGGLGVGDVHRASLLPVPGLGGGSGVRQGAAVVRLPGRVADVLEADHLLGVHATQEENNDEV